MAYKLKSSIDSLCSGSPAKAIDPMYNGVEGVQQGDFAQFSSAAKMNAKKGDGPVYNLSGKKGLQPSNNPAVAYMTGSPVNNLGHGRLGFHVHLGSTSDDTDNKASGDSSVSRQPEPLSAEDKAYFDTRNLPTREQRLANEAENKKTASAPISNPKKVVKREYTIKTSGVSKSSGATGKEDKGTTIKTSKITSKKSTPPSAKITKAQIKANKADNKESGMSKRQIRLEKTKLKAANARYETTSDKTKAIGGKEGQRKAAKTKRLEKRASRIEGRIKRKADKKANK